MPKVHTRVTLEKSGWKFRRLEQVLHVHPEKYRARSNRNTRNNTPVSHVSQRSHSIDYMNSSVSDNLTASRLDSSSGKCHVPMIPEEHDPEKPVHIPLNPNRLHYHAGHTGDIVTINVAGLKFQTWESTLERFPDSLLGHPVKRSKFWNPKRQEYFIDRHRSCFEAMLYIYQSGGRIRRPESVPIDLFLRELKFYQMGDEVLEQFWISEGYEKPKENLMPKNSYQRRLWELMEYPDSSLSARIVAFISVFVIVTSIISFCLETIPELKPSNEGRDWSNPFFWIEFICIIWFSIELFLRFLSCPSKISFLKSFLNIVDFIAIAPFFVNLVWSDAGGTSSSMSFAVLRVLRLVRVFRIFKLSRHSVGLQILGKTFRASIQEFCLLIFFMVIALVLFSSGVYFAEQSEPNTKFTSIPASFWFVLVTMTTVGYGDLVPVGTYGKLVGSCCALIGVLTLALPVPIIVANFKHFYRQETRLATMRASREHDENSTASLDSDDEDDSIS